MRDRATGTPLYAAGVDLSRKTSLVGRGLRKKASQVGLLTRLSRIASFLWRIAGLIVSCSLLVWVAPSLPLDEVGFFDGALFLLLASVLVLRIHARIALSRFEARSPSTLPFIDQLDFAVAAVVLTHVIVLFSGGEESLYRPLVYLVVAVLVVFSSVGIAIASVGLALSVELISAFLAGYLVAQAGLVAVHGVFILVFALLYHLLISGILDSFRHKTDSTITAMVEDLRRRAREYRLIVSSEDAGIDVPGGKVGREKWVAAAVEQVERAFVSCLETIECALKTHTVALYILSPDEKTMVLRECISASDHISSRPLVAGEGLLGVVIRRHGPVRMCGVFRGAIYYSGGPSPKAFIGVPLIERSPADPEQEYVRGVLIADRLEAEPFAESDERLLSIVGEEIVRTIEVERVMGYIREEKDEKARFYRAIESLNVLSKPDEISGAVVRLATEIAPCLDFVAMTIVDGEDSTSVDMHKIVEAIGPGSEGLKGEMFEDNAGLVANVVRLGSPLPGRDFYEMERKIVFSESIKLKGLDTLKVLPLIVSEKVVGTMVCGAKRRGALVGDSVRQLSVLAIQAAGAITRARLFEKTEKMATTDSLTGLNNHARFQEALESSLASSRRYERSLSLIFADVDHFKSVNDTYGHPIGDYVLVNVARLLLTEARDADVVARYGGEEFAVILPETNLEGAQVIAERIRSRLEKEVFRTEVGDLRVTLSLGISAFPDHGDQKQALINMADQALYRAKNKGRNCFFVAR